MRLLERRTGRRWPDPIGVALALQDLQPETSGNVKRNVAVYEPCAGIIGFEGYDHVPTSRQQYYVAARGVLESEVEGMGGEGFVVGLLKDGKVVAVEVDL